MQIDILIPHKGKGLAIYWLEYTWQQLDLFLSGAAEPLRGGPDLVDAEGEHGVVGDGGGDGADAGEGRADRVHTGVQGADVVVVAVDVVAKGVQLVGGGEAGHHAHPDDAQGGDADQGRLQIKLTKVFS